MSARNRCRSGWVSCWRRLAAANWSPGRPDLIVPVPMFWRRRISRRTSSAEILATTLGKRLRVSVVVRGVVRQRNTQPQGDLSPRERRANVRNAFLLRRPKLVADRRVAAGRRRVDDRRHPQRSGAGPVTSRRLKKSPWPSSLGLKAQNSNPGCVQLSIRYHLICGIS